MSGMSGAIFLTVGGVCILGVGIRSVFDMLPSLCDMFF